MTNSQQSEALPITLHERIVDSINETENNARRRRNKIIENGLFLAKCKGAEEERQRIVGILEEMKRDGLRLKIDEVIERISDNQ